MNTTRQLIVTAQPEFAQVAVTELQQLEPQVEQCAELAPGIVLCAVPHAEQFMQRAARQHPLFVRHLAPVQTSLPLDNSEQDIGAIAAALAALPTFGLLERGIHFSVQSRLISTDKSQGKRPYSSGQINQALAAAIVDETKANESIKKPQIVVSILCTSDTGYLGISPVEDNLSSWPGGARQFAQTAEQISRAEFKLLEALDVFGVSLPSEGRALDLGAAPGGWTRLLLEAGMSVVAVDPARLDPRLAGRKHLEHYQGYAEDYIEAAVRKGQHYDVIVNDMRMDAREAARLLARAARSLKKEGFMISVLKLPHATQVIDPLKTLKEALNILSQQYTFVQTQQLFHNRQEVTLVAAHPRQARR
ncbi:MAG TPA: SAM-dependent methyltransferase [Ktedonobacteraceae bacterium]|nr:SAM-dependent methyltransferase [Ktedonobacteraceae bacterium]